MPRRMRRDDPPTMFTTSRCCFVVVPDITGTASAQFEELTDAIDWGLARYGGDRFAVRYLDDEGDAAEDPGRGPMASA